MFLEDGDGKWNMILNNPFDEFLMSVLRFAVVGDGIFQGWARHRDDSCLNTDLM